MIQAEQLYRSQQKEGLLAWIQIEIATILLNQNKVVEAVSKLQQADAILRGGESSDSVTLGHWQLVMGMAEAAQSNPTKALYYLAQAEPIFVKEKNQRFLARVYEVRARILEQQGQINGALASLKKYVETKHSLERVLREQRSLQMRFEFDLARKELENQALKTKQLLQEAKLKQLQERRHWQYAVVILLLLVMGMLALHQFNRSRKMRRLAMTDDLTGLHNRRQIQAKGQAWFKQAREHGKTLSVLQLDIDHFKQVNDTLGHHMGTRCWPRWPAASPPNCAPSIGSGATVVRSFWCCCPTPASTRRSRWRSGSAIGSPSCASTGCRRGSRCTSASAVPSTAPRRELRRSGAAGRRGHVPGQAGGPQPGDAGRVGRAGHPARLQSRAGYFSLARV